MLELIRQKRVKAVQPGEFTPIELQLLDAEPILVDEEADYRSVTATEDPEQINTSDDDVEDSFEIEGLTPEAATDETEPKRGLT